MEYAEYLRRLPKVELHCHVEGTLRPQTVADLAAKHDIALPTTDVDGIYDYQTIYEFLEIFRLVNSTVIDHADFARIAYESIEDGARLGSLKYREMFFNPTLHTTRGVPMATIIDGLIEGCRAAEDDLGVRCRLIADVYRQDSPAMALQMTNEVLANRRAEVIGLGMDSRGAGSSRTFLRGLPRRG
jgi:adenosine deaminase